MPKSKNKTSFKEFINNLNQIDVNDIIDSLKKINVEDLRKIDINELSRKLRKSPILRPAIGIASASVLFAFILLPGIKSMISTFNKANQYEIEALSLDSNKVALKNKKDKIEKLSLLMSEINNSILKKDKLIFVSKLIDETALKANVEISSFSPIDVARSGKLCKQSKNNKSSRNKKNNVSRKGAFESNFYEINLKSDYLNIIEFLKIIQYYDVTIIPHCLEVYAAKPPTVNPSKEFEINPTIIIPLSESGVPINNGSQNGQLGEAVSYGGVKSRLVLQIPSHSR